jgi:isopenicillin N synthase-like dioxygenase
MSLSLPVVDISKLHSQDPGERASVGETIRKACLDKGFMYVVGHGVDHQLMDRVFMQSKAFFDQPLDFKMALLCDSKEARRGYEPEKLARFEPGTAPDLKESFYIGADMTADDPRCFAGQFDCGPNRWPSLQGWRDDMEAYFNQMMAFGRILYSGLALSLDLQADFFDKLLNTEPHAILRLLKYPPQEGGADTNQRGIGAHTDFGGLSLLTQDSVGGLQVHDGANGWIDVPPVEGAYIINLGDMIARWTNDRYRSTLHRVINQADKERYSVAFFINGNPDHVVSCLPTCLAEGDQPHYPPITVGNHIRERVRDTYAALAAAS